MAQSKSLFDIHTQRKHNDDRMRRAKAWLKRSERPRTTVIERFIFLWISFNAAYGDENSLKYFAEESGKKGSKRKKPSETYAFRKFLFNVIDLGEILLSKMFEEELQESFESFLENPCISREFWRVAREEDVSKLDDWKKEFQKENDDLMEAWRGKNFKNFLPQIFMRLYVLRNQIIHGGTTYPYGVGRRQIAHGTAVMSFLIPIILEIMESDIQKCESSVLWKKVSYPSFDPDVLSTYGISDHKMPVRSLE